MPADPTAPPALAERLDLDEPIPLEPDLPPEIGAPLRVFAGAEPPAPDWFKSALALAPERGGVTVKGANIELLTWGDVGKPGLIFVHGSSAHADWWSYIAPFFAGEHRVAAISLSGMGGSDWREAYDFPTYAEEIHAGALAAGLHEAPVKPVYIGHSFGGTQVFHATATHPERMSGAILIDCGYNGPPTPAGETAVGPPTRTRPNRVYATLEEALGRFRFSPPQVPGNLCVADYIARHSLRRAPMADGSGEGWTWKFDPFLWRKMERTDLRPLLDAEVPPLAQIMGDSSTVMMRRLAGERSENVPPDLAPIIIPDAEHHITVDQPLALVASLRSILRLWAA
jgi:pimeloyl-ACP methyl ester carboxylesterase